MSYYDENRMDSVFFERAGKFLAGEMDNKEAKLFRESYDSDESLREEFKQLERLWEAAHGIKVAETIDLDRAKEKVMKKAHLSGSVKVKNPFVYMERIAAILFIPLLIVSILFYYSNKPSREGYATYNEIDNSYGTVSKLTLPDGTKVWLNSGSHFKYPLFFTKGMRKVYLTGEAYFEVAKDRKRPFIVNTSAIDVIATGTVFDVMAYNNDDVVVATLVEGKISMAKESVSHKIKPLTTVHPGQKAILNKTKKKIAIQKADVEEVTAWRNGKLIFRNDPMDVVVKRLDRWYNTDIILTDKKLKTYRYTATFEGETLQQILELLKHTAPIEYKIYPRKKQPDQTFSKAKVEIRIRKN